MDIILFICQHIINVCNVIYKNVSICMKSTHFLHIWGRRGRDRMVVGFTTTYVISAYHH
jgi:hypothetical protein